jgi:hypothetical protein
MYGLSIFPLGTLIRLFAVPDPPELGTSCG